jgi:hypothetical protein
MALAHPNKYKGTGQWRKVEENRAKRARNVPDGHEKSRPEGRPVKPSA